MIKNIIWIASDVLFWLGMGLLILSIILFEIGTKYLREKKDLKRKEFDKRGWKFLAYAGVFLAISLLLSFVV
ncbi:MAG: hypothetical protein J7L34_07780 [Thermotogaceae bacterium]|nr:hypothetical protein [Thermotogaceae bacterium]